MAADPTSLSHLRRALEAATPGELRVTDLCVYGVDEHGVTYFCEAPDDRDRTLIVSLVNAAPALLDVVEAAEKYYAAVGNHFEQNGLDDICVLDEEAAHEMRRSGTALRTALGRVGR